MCLIEEGVSRVVVVGVMVGKMGGREKGLLAIVPLKLKSMPTSRP